MNSAHAKWIEELKMTADMMSGEDSEYEQECLRVIGVIRLVDDCAGLIGRLARALKNAQVGAHHSLDDKLADSAIDFLRRKDLMGSPLRKDNGGSMDCATNTPGDAATSPAGDVFSASPVQTQSPKT